MKEQKDNNVNADDLSILAWILNNKIVSEKDELLDFTDRLFLLDILTDWSRDIVIKKCAQIGGSITFNLKVLFAVLKLKWNVIYTMPSDGDVKDFVSAKTNQLIKSNSHVFGGMDGDSIERKELDDRFLFFKGTISKTAAISTTSDCNVHDEASRSDQTVIEMYKSRLKASKIKRRWMFSNPTTEKDAIDIAWNKSDRKEWMITCTDCEFEQTLTWPESINIEKRVYQCKNCKKELTTDERRLGRWVAQAPGKPISGYHISLMMAPWIDADEIIRDSEGDQEYFHNFVLGEPYSPGDLRVSRGTIIDCWTPRDIATGNYYLGVDVGNVKHYALGSEKGLIRVGRFSAWKDLDDLLAKYNPVSFVIDAFPDNTMARHYVDTYRGTNMSVFKENKDNPKTIVWWGKGKTENDRAGIVYSNRNRILDQMIDDIVRADILFGMPSDQEFKQYLKHWDTLRRNKVVDPRGIESYEWDSTTGEDHYCFVAGTKILTDKGERNIEELSVGDKVLTRNGFEKIKFTDNYLTNVIRRGGITGTPDHPVFVGDKKYKRFDSLMDSDMIYTCKASVLYIKALYFVDTLIQKVERIGFILPRVGMFLGKELGGYIRKYIRIILEKFQKVLQYIIRILIRLIMTRRTWKQYQEENMVPTIYQSGLKRIGQKISSILGVYYRKLIEISHCGAKRRQERSFYLKMREGLLSWLSPRYSLVYSVVKNQRHSHGKEVDFVAKNVLESISLGSGEKNTRNTGNAILDRVYTLEVENTHEYFADGMLVSNCFATLYWYLAVMGQGVGAFFKEPVASEENKPFIGNDNIVGNIGEMLADANQWDYREN